MKKLTIAQKETARKIMTERKIDEIYMDKKSNFFLTSNIADLSKEKDEKIIHIRFADTVTEKDDIAKAERSLNENADKKAKTTKK